MLRSITTNVDMYLCVCTLGREGSLTLIGIEKKLILMDLNCVLSFYAVLA